MAQFMTICASWPLAEPPPGRNIRLMNEMGKELQALMQGCFYRH